MHELINIHGTSVYWSAAHNWNQMGRMKDHHYNENHHLPGTDWNNHGNTDLITVLFAWMKIMMTFNFNNDYNDDYSNDAAVVLIFLIYRHWIRTLGTTVLWCTGSSSRLLLVKMLKTAKTALSSNRTAAWWRRRSCTETWGGHILSLRWLPQTTMVKDTAARQR